MKNMLKLGLSLAIYASVACVCLSLVNMVTAPAIAAAKERELNAGLAVVFADADTFEAAPGFVSDTATSVKVTNLYLAKKAGQVMGAVVQANGPTYDKAEMLIGVTLNRSITGIQFLSLTDTPGFGQKAAEPEFSNQFAGKSIDDAFSAGSDVDMIGGATITTKGVSQLIKYATYVAGEYLAANCGGAAGTGEAPVIAAAATSFTFEEACESIFPAEEYGEISIHEVEEGIGDVARSMIVEQKAFALSGDKIIAAMVAVRGQTYKYGGVVLTAVGADGNIIGARILELNDDQNQGQLALEESYYNQFTGLNAAESILNGEGKYDAITGATITSDCVADMVKVGAVEAVNMLAEKGLGVTAIDQNSYQLNENYLEE